VARVSRLESASDRLFDPNWIVNKMALHHSNINEKIFEIFQQFNLPNYAVSSSYQPFVTDYSSNTK
jgi:hypothetical protein